jgi:hypothetical protein
MRFTFATSLVLVGCLAACGGTTEPDTQTTDGGTDSATTGDTIAPADFCEALDARAMKCDAGAVSGCDVQLACYQAILRPENVEPLLGCFAGRACGSSEDKCVGDVSAKYESDPATTSYVMQCTAKRTECMNVFVDDYCAGDWGLFNDDARAKLQGCLSGACDGVKKCFDGVYASFGCK